MKVPKKLRVFATDFAGVVLVICSILFGWIPGPGGIPLFLAGLGLLAINHEWARRLLKWFKNQLLKQYEAMSKQHPAVHTAYDVTAVIMIIGAVWILNEVTKNLTRSIGISLLFLGIGLLLGNRNRLERFTSRIRKRNKS